VWSVIDRRTDMPCRISQALHNELQGSRAQTRCDRTDAGLPAGHFTEQLGWNGEGLDEMLNDLGGSRARYGNTFGRSLLARLLEGLCMAGGAQQGHQAKL